MTRRRKWRTTKRDKDARPAPDLVQREFAAEGPDQLWVADITYVSTGSGFLYLAVVVDAWSRRVVGWSMQNHLRTDLVVQALDMALLQRRPKDVIHHSDQGTQPRFKGSSQQHRVEGGFLRPRFHWTIDWRGRRGPDRGVLDLSNSEGVRSDRRSWKAGDTGAVENSAQGGGPVQRCKRSSRVSAGVFQPRVLRGRLLRAARRRRDRQRYVC